MKRPSSIFKPRDLKTLYKKAHLKLSPLLAGVLSASLVIATNSAKANSCYPYGHKGISPQADHQISFYKENFEKCRMDNTDFFIIRSFHLDGNPSSLAVDPDSGSSRIISRDCLSQCSLLYNDDLMSRRYGQIVARSGEPPYPVQNDGLTSGHAQNGQVALTIDMCPSSKGISQEVYDLLIQMAKVQRRAVPIGVAMTRKWLQKYPQKFEFLKQAQLKGWLQIDWINHSSNHRYSSKVNVRQNFLLLPNTDLRDEVLGNELAMIQAGVTPSSYFRFPGLVSSQRLVDTITEWGLAILGSDAWLAKGERPHSGSIILIHGNKNEPVGEEKFKTYIQNMNRMGHRFSSLQEVL